MSRPTVNYTEAGDPKPIIIGKWKAEWNAWGQNWDLYHYHEEHDPDRVPNCTDGWWQCWMNHNEQPICPACKIEDLSDIDEGMKIHMELQKLGMPQRPQEETSWSYLSGASFYFTTSGTPILSFYSSFTVTGSGAFFR
jgi:hypothetical protein